MPLIMIFFLVSCSKETPTPVTVTIYGKWNILKYQEISNGVVDYNYIGKPNDYLEFKLNKSYTIYVDSSIIESGMFEINGSILCFDSTDIWDVSTLTSSEAIIERSTIKPSSSERFIFYLKR
jgi:hypothetical protein